jgi:hypothetical protein
MGSDAWPRRILAQLSKSDRWLVGQLLLGEHTEADIAARTGITQQAISKRKRGIVTKLRQYIDRTNPAENLDNTFMKGGSSTVFGIGIAKINCIRL